MSLDNKCSPKTGLAGSAGTSDFESCSPDGCFPILCAQWDLMLDISAIMMPHVHSFCVL